LTGLPPTPDECIEFENDPRVDAYEHLVDRLMHSRAYAERRAQEWLDLARYADTCGFADDGPQDIWIFRDWVIEALHRNLPFDQFTIEQLAGDMLPAPTTQQLIATGFHRNAPQARGSTYPVEEYRVKGVVDRVNTTGKVWFGLTVGCAECHNHKFDPLSQKEFYSLFALFNNVEHTGTGFSQGGPLLALPSEDQARELDLLQAEAKRLTPPNPDTKEAFGKINKALDTLQKQIPKAPILRELPEPRPAFVHRRGNFLQKGDPVQAEVPAFFGEASQTQPRNRLEFARWLVNGKNPLVSRVVVNRFWQEHFGSGLVRTPDDFGLHGEPPSHPELLDWLAREFVESGWDMKHMHRLMVTSATYKQSARVTPEQIARDPQNLWLARAPRPRLAAEQIRDQALAVSGLPDGRPGGPPVFPEHPVHYWRQRGLKGTWKTSTGGDLHRRTLYTYWRRMALHPSLELLDAPSRVNCVARRSVSNVPTQALVLLNDPLFTEATRAFARRLLDDSAASPRLRLERAFRLLLARDPDSIETENLLRFIETQTLSLRNDTAAAQSIIAEPTVPSPAEAAAWTLLAGVLLNLDETIVRP
jgi:hypothetical protein